MFHYRVRYYGHSREQAVFRVRCKSCGWAGYFANVYESRSFVECPACFIHVRDDDPYMLETEGPILTQRNDGSTNLTVNVALYIPQEGQAEQVECHNAVKQLVENLFTVWKRKLVISNQYFLFRHNFKRNNVRTLPRPVRCPLQVN